MMDENIMTLKKNYFKICGSKQFVRAASQLITEKFQVVFKTDVRQSDSDDDVFFLYVNIADSFLEPKP
jgi:hypothetical protein